MRGEEGEEEVGGKEEGMSEEEGEGEVIEAKCFEQVKAPV